MARARKPRKKKGVIRVDFTDVETGGGKPVPDGEYTARLAKVEEREGESSGEPYLSCQWKIVGGKSDGATVYDNISLQPQSLWRFRTILECLGLETEDGEMDISTEDMVDSECLIEVTNEEYDGKDKPRITGFLSSDDEDDEGDDEEEEEDGEEEEEDEPDEEEEEEAPKKRSRKPRAKKIRVGSKVKFEDEEGDTVKGVVTDMDDDAVWVEDSSGDVWEVGADEVTAA